MPRRLRLFDDQWESIRALLPSSAGRRGRPWADHRRVVEAIVYRYRTGIPWRAVAPCTPMARSRTTNLPDTRSAAPAEG
ncbi:MAG: transposase [Corynebacterium sp.]|uniref:transposase n=1 Tax=Corynebacterium TaxID=1716 RepID=UPI0034D960FA